MFGLPKKNWLALVMFSLLLFWICLNKILLIMCYQNEHYKFKNIGWFHFISYSCEYVETSVFIINWQGLFHKIKICLLDKDNKLKSQKGICSFDSSVIIMSHYILHHSLMHIYVCVCVCMFCLHLLQNVNPNFYA